MATIALDTMHDAASIISTEGSEGIAKASKLVGRQIAIAMLIQHLRERYTPQQVDFTLAEHVLSDVENRFGVVG